MVKHFSPSQETTHFRTQTNLTNTLVEIQSKSMDVEEHIVADAEKLLIHKLRLLDVEPNVIEYDLIGICKKYYQI